MGLQSLCDFGPDVSDVPFREKRGKCLSLRPKICGDFGPTPIARGGSRAKASPLAAHAKLRKTPRSQALGPYGPKKEGEEDTHRLGHTLKTHVEKNRTGSWLMYAKKEGGRETSREGMLGSRWEGEGR